MTESDAPELDAVAILRVLDRHDVDYVVIGAWAALAHGAPGGPTRDIDITPAAEPQNLARLSAALKELGARIRVEGIAGGLAFDHDAESLGRSAVWNLVCRHGELDISFVPSGTAGFPDLVERAHSVAISDVVVRIADLADIVRSKEAAGRPKDIVRLPALYEHLRQKRGKTDGDAEP